LAEIPIEKRFRILSDILRAQHFAWRAAASEHCPGTDPRDLVVRMWEVTGDETARAYLKRLDPEAPVAPQVARSIVWSSRCMDEEAAVEQGASPGEAYVRHRACPWRDWHERMGLLRECRPGCDAWFGRTVLRINEALGCSLSVETLEALPDGDTSCLRRIRGT